MGEDMIKKVNYSKWYPLLILFSFLFMSIGYASINLITTEISGLADAKAQTGVFITDVSLSSSLVSDTLSSVNNYYKTMLESTTTLSSIDANSTVTYTITLYNNSESSQTFNGVKYDTSFYDNENIVFELSGLNVGDQLIAKSSVTFTVTFHYLDYVLASSNSLNSYLNFEFKRSFSVQYVNVSSTDIINNQYPTTIMEGDTLNVTIVGKISNLSVTMGSNTLLVDSDYTFIDNVLNVPNVDGDIVIEVETVVSPVQGEDGHYFEGSTVPGGGAVLEDGWTGDVYNLTFGVNGTIGSVTTYTYTVKLINDTNYAWTDLQNTDVIVNAGGGWFGKALQGFSSSLSQNTLNPGETLVVTFTVRYRTNLDCTASGQTIIKFNVNGEEKQLELNINFNMN